MDRWATLEGENGLCAEGRLVLSPRLNYVRHAYKTWNGYVDNHLKSAIQKLIRRSSPSTIRKALASLDKELWPLVYFVIELDLFKTVTFPGRLADAYKTVKKPTRELNDAIRTNLENRLRVIALEDIGMANPLLPLAVDKAMPLAKVKVGGKKVNADNPKGLLQVVVSEGASPKCRLYSHLKTLFALPPYYWESTHDKAVKGEKTHQKAERLRSLWFTLVKEAQGVTMPPDLETLHTKSEEALKKAFVEGVVGKRIEAFAYLSAALYGVFTAQGTEPYDSKGKGGPGGKTLKTTLASNLLKSFTEAALKTIKHELNRDVLETVKVMKGWFKEMTHAEKPLYLYHVITMMIYRDHLKDEKEPDLFPLTDHQTSILYKANLEPKPLATGVPLPIPSVAQDIHTSSKGKADKDIVDFAMSGSYVEVPSDSPACGHPSWAQLYKVYKMGQVANKKMSADAAKALFALVRPYDNKDPSAEETKVLKQEIGRILEPLETAFVSSKTTKTRTIKSRRPRSTKTTTTNTKTTTTTTTKRSRSTSQTRSKVRKTERKSRIPRRTTKMARYKCSLDETKLKGLMEAGGLKWISPSSEEGKTVAKVIEKRLLAQNRCGSGKLFTLVGDDEIVKGPLSFSSPRKLVLNLGLNILLKRLEEDSKLGEERMGGIMPSGLFRNEEGIWIVWPNLGPSYGEGEVTRRSTKVDTDYKVVDREKKDIRLSAIAKAGEMSAKEAIATLQHLYWRGILMGGDSGSHNVIRTYKGDRPVGGIDLEEIRGDKTRDSDDPWLVLFKSVPDAKQRKAFEPHLDSIVLMDRLSRAFTDLADRLASLVPGCGLESGEVYTRRLARVNDLMAKGKREGWPVVKKVPKTKETKSKKTKETKSKASKVRSRSISPSRSRVLKKKKKQRTITDFTPLDPSKVIVIE